MCEIINLGEDANVIICGGEKDHECNEDSSVFLLENGERVEITPENQEKYMEQIRGGSTCCSICGHAAIDDAYKL